ncbi:DUF2793 domain-containing protein [Aquamicrobium terrae]|uniref:Uncharacterized protein n=1 Tax=Aquamicrobium terrae TaxID=1324945 RepID=A0ABV2N2R5_9HYPH
MIQCKHDASPYIWINFKGLIMATAAFANPVISVISSPPASPTNGDRYLIAPSGTSGAFAGKENQVAECTAGAWVDSGAPASGQQLMVGQLMLQ